MIGRVKYSLVFFFFVFLFVGGLHSEDWTHFTCIENPRAVTVDPYRPGLVWFATSGGLAKYHTTEESWKVYTNSEGLSKIWCRSVLVDEDCLWVGTENEGANRFDRETERLTPFIQDIINPYAPRRTVNCFADDDQNLWVGTDEGALCVDKESLEIIEEITVDDGLSTNWVFSIIAEPEYIWFAATFAGGYIPEFPPDVGGLSRYERATGDVRTFRAGEGPYINWFWAMIDDGDDLWLGSDRGLYAFSKNSLTFTQVLCDSIRSVFSLAVEKDTLWCGSRRKIFKIDTGRREILETYDTAEAPYGEVYSLSLDDEYVWVAVHGCINVIDRRQHTVERVQTPFLPERTVYALAHKDGFAYIGAQSQLVQVDIERMTILNRDITQGALGPPISSTIHCLAFDGDYLWIGKNSGLKKFNIHSMEVEESYLEEPYSESASVRCIVLEDPFLWLGTINGFVRLDKRNGERVFFRYPELDGPWTSDILSDGEHLWIGSRSGLFRFDKNTQDLEKITDVRVEALCDDGEYVWFGSAQLKRMEKESLVITTYTTPRDIRDMTMYHGYLWVATHEGAFLFDTARDTVVRHYTEEGHVTHNWVNCVHLTDTHVWLGSYGGASALDLSSVAFEPSKGDVNGDGRLDVTDVVIAVNIILGTRMPTPEQFWAADYNDDGAVDIRDVVLMVCAMIGG
ncbi:MAG: hypothetical protein JSV84_08935 [Gemmatimonadota bacterium]|nr:MAG: hypothetical protein JSV84_08935 [Gemmatimonadota bacterium]